MCPNALGVDEIPFLDRMLIVFVVVIIGMVIISKLFPKRTSATVHKIEIDRSMFRVEPSFALGSAIICLGLVAIYSVWW